MNNRTGILGISFSTEPRLQVGDWPVLAVALRDENPTETGQLRGEKMSGYQFPRTDPLTDPLTPTPPDCMWRNTRAQPFLWSRQTVKVHGAGGGKADLIIQIG